MKKARFEWNADKDAENQKKHGVAFSLAQLLSLILTVLSPKILHIAKRKSVIFVSVRLKVAFLPSASLIAVV